MTYFGFLLRFLLIPILIFLFIIIWDNKRNKQIPGFRHGRAIWTGIAIHILLAVVYTTPWDNYLVATGVWYYNPELVTGFVIGYVPIEEYTFFVVETILAGLWWWFLARRVSPPAGAFKPSRPMSYLSSLISFSLVIKSGTSSRSSLFGLCLRFFRSLFLARTFCGIIANSFFGLFSFQEPICRSWTSSR